MCSLVRAWYSALSRIITLLMVWCLLSFGLHAGLTRRGGPFRDLGRDIGGELSRAVANHLSALLAQPVADVRQRERRDSSVVQPRQDQRRRAGGRKPRAPIVSHHPPGAPLPPAWNLRHAP